MQVFNSGARYGYRAVGQTFHEQCRETSGTPSAALYVSFSLILQVDGIVGLPKCIDDTYLGLYDP